MKTTFLLSLVLVMTPFASAKSPADFQRRLDEWIKGQPGGVAVAWVDAEGPVFFQSGRFDGADSPAITPDTQFELGSVTKVFTALLLAESERLGKVNRTDPAAKYLLPPADPDQAALAKITLLALTTHISGLPRLSSNIGPNPDANPDPYAKYDRAMLVKALRRDGAVAPAGRAVAYSNFGVAVLGEALGAAWGTSYADALRTHVLDPLGMKATTVGLAGLPPPPDFPPAHANGKVVPSFTWQAYAPAGGLRSSARDLAILLTACLDKSTGPMRVAIEATLRPQQAHDVFVGHIGLGWFIIDEGVAWHSGATGGSQALVAFNPGTGTGIAMLTNARLGSDALYFELLGVKAPQVRVETIKGAADFVGRYTLARAFSIDITEKNGVLSGWNTGQPFVLWRIAADRFGIVGVPAEISFERGADGKVAALVLNQNGRDQRAPRGVPPKEVVLPGETLREYVGEYPLAPQFLLTITERDGALFVEITGDGKAPLFASAKDEFFYRGMDAQISFQRDAAGKVTGLILHQYGGDAPATKK